MIWSELSNAQDIYFYNDWCPYDDGKWKWNGWDEFTTELDRSIRRTFNYTELQGYTNNPQDTDVEMPIEYNARNDVHAREIQSEPLVSVDSDLLMHNALKSYLEVSEWVGDGDYAAMCGTHNGYVSRKMSLRWLFDSIRALINFRVDIEKNKYAQETIYPLVGSERFLSAEETSACGITGDEYQDD